MDNFVKMLALTRYGQQGASSRMRFYQYQPWLEAAGIQATIAPLFSDAYVCDLQQNIRDPIKVARAYAGRIRTLLSNRRFDLIWIEKEALPWLPAWFEEPLLPSSVPYVLDYDDAVFHYYDEHRNSAVKSFFKGKHPTLIKSAALVVAGNQYLAEFAQRAGALNVETLPTVIDLSRYPLSKLKREGDDELPCVGWIGQRATASFLAPYVSLFKRMSVEGRARFAAIGINAQSLGLPMASLPWTEQTEVAAISSFDIGIMPLVDGSFERGKCGYKLIQYMACGIPVVASPVGVNCQIVKHGVNGFLAETSKEWEQALQTLLGDSGLRQRMGQAGRQMVERQYCIQVTGPRLVAILKHVAKSFSGRK